MKKIIAMLLALVLALSLCACGSSGKGAAKDLVAHENDIVSGLLNDDGHAVVTPISPESYEIPGNIFVCHTTPDKTKAVALEWDRKMTLYTNLANLDETVMLTDNGDAIAYAADTGVLYTDQDDIFYRYTYADGETLTLGDLDDYCVENEFDILYAKDGNIYLLLKDAAEGEKIATYDQANSISLGALSKDGSAAIWYEKKGSNYDIFICENGEKTRMGSMDISSSYATVNTYFNQTGTWAIAYSLWSNVLYVKSAGKDVIKIKFSDELDTAPYTKVNTYRWDNSPEFPGLYVLVDAEKDNNLYYVDSEGEREKLVSGVLDFAVSNGTLFYVDSDNNLYRTEVTGKDMAEPVKIAGDVNCLHLPLNGDCIYYIKSFDNNEGALYAYKKGTEEPVKVASSVYCFAVGTAVYSQLKNSTDGNTVYYYTDVEENVGAPITTPVPFTPTPTARTAA